MLAAMRQAAGSGATSASRILLTADRQRGPVTFRVPFAGLVFAISLRTPALPSTSPSTRKKPTRRPVTGAQEAEEHQRKIRTDPRFIVERRGEWHPARLVVMLARSRRK